MNLTVLRAPLALVAASSCIAGAALVVSTNSRAVVEPGDNGTWVANSAAESVSHLGPGGADATVPLPGIAGDLQIVEMAGVAYVVDDDGRISRIDPVGLEVSAEALLPSDDAGLVAGGGRLYLLDAGAGTARELDPSSLLPIGDQVDVGDEPAGAVVDPDGVLWVADAGAGDLVAVDGDAVVSRENVTSPGADLRVALVEAGVAAVDADAAAVVAVGGAKRAQAIDLELATDGSLLVPDVVKAGHVLPAVDGDGLLAAADLDSAEVDHIDLGVAGNHLGAPEIVAGRVFVPDYTAGALLLVEPGPGGSVTTIPLTETPGRFDVVPSAEMIYANDPASERAWAIAADGTVTDIEKYDPDAPGGGSDDRPPEVPPAPELPPPPELPQPDQRPVTADAQQPDLATEIAPPVLTVPPPVDGAPGPDIGPTTQRPITSNDGSRGSNRSNESDGSDGGSRGPQGPDGGGGRPVTTTPPPTTTTPPPTTTTPPPPTITPPPTTVSGPGDGAVRSVVATAGDGTATVTWEPPDDWHRVTGYRVVTEAGTGPTRVAATQTSYTVSGLANGDEYRFVVTALSAAGDGASVRSNVVMPRGAPGRPGAVTATSSGSGRATVSWEAAPANGSTVTGYTVTADGADDRAVGGDSTSIIVDGLTNGATYTFRVRASNAVGDGPAREAAPITLLTYVPDRPGDVSAQGGDRRVTISWSEPSGNGATIVGYEVQDEASGVRRTVTDRTYTWADLVNGQTYNFRVRAVGDGGEGPWQSAGPVTLQSYVPDAPGGVNAVAGDRSATVSWSAPNGNGTGIAGYEVRNTTTNQTQSASGTSFTFSGLDNGTSYSFEVTAIGDNGNRGPAASSSAVVPNGAPAAPTSLTVSNRTHNSATLSFSSPSPSNGTAVSQWRVTINPGGEQTVGSTTVPFGGLQPSTGYTVTVVALGANGQSSQPATVSFTTDAAPPPGAVTGLTAYGGQVSESQCEPGWDGGASWNAASGAAHYIVDEGRGGGPYTVTGTSVSWAPSMGTHTFSVTPVSEYGVHGSTVTAEYTATYIPPIPPDTVCP